jgi:pyridoxine 4-dehydrogenase
MIGSLVGRPVSRIGFGAMQLPGPGVFGPPADRDRALAVLRRAIELGVNHIDTSQYYGPNVSNELIRSALHPYPDDLVLVSKVGARRTETGGWQPAEQPAELRAGVEANLRALGVERLDVVNLRRMGAAAPAGYRPPELADQLDEMVKLRDEGKIAGVGLSNVSLEQVRFAAGRTDLACVQNAFSLVAQDDLGVLTFCREIGIPYVPFFPLGPAFAGGGPRLRVVEQPAVLATAERLGATPAQVGLAWVLAQGDHVLLIPGTSSLEHLEENLGSGKVVLDDEALSALSGVRAG